MKTHLKTFGVASVLAAALLVLSGPAPALAQCPIGTDAGAECVVSTAVQASGTHIFGKTLHITSSGKIEVVPEATGLNLDIAGDLKMDAGAVIDGNVTGAAKGATIVINTAGDILLAGGSPGAVITSSQNPAPAPPGSCTPVGGGGDISLFAGGNVTMGNGSAVTSTSPCGRGYIQITGVILNLDGLVLSEGRTSKGRGGPIDIKASCDLIVSPTGEIISLGRDPGADRVHLEGGCTVRVLGLVASTGQGHSGGVSDNKCQGTERPDKPANSRACVEIWSGDTVLIDSVTPNNGEVHADTGFAGGVAGFGWVDIFAVNDVTIVGDSVAPFAVHVNQTLSNGHGGAIQVKSKLGNVVTSGLALQASDSAGGGQGGSILVEANLNVDFEAATIEAKGGNAGGGAQKGGTIGARAFNGIVSGAAPGTLNAGGGGGQAIPDLGLVTLQGCGTNNPNDGVTYTGVVVPAPATILADACGGEPSFQTYVVFPICACACVCVSSTTTATGAGGPTTNVRGTGLKQVTDVFINSNTCDPGFGTHFTKQDFLLQTDTVIRVPGALVSGSKIVTVGPSGSCCMTAP